MDSCHFYFENLICGKAAVGGYFISPRYNLCEILGAPYSEKAEKADKEPDIKEVRKKNETYELLKKYTTDETILSRMNQVAFTQDELINLACAIAEKACQQEADDDDKVIYLCGEHFEIPRFIGGITYKGINNPKVEFWGDPTSEEKVEAGIDFQDVDISFDDYVAEYDELASFCFLSDFETNPNFALRLIQMSVEKGTVEAWIALGDCYERGIGVKKDIEEALKCYQKAAEQGYEYDEMNKMHLSTLSMRVEWLERNKTEAEQGNEYAQYDLGEYYLSGREVAIDEKEAVKWFSKAAEQGHGEALVKLETLYRDHLDDEIGREIAEVLNTLKK